MIARMSADAESLVPYVNAGILLNYSRTIFLPYLINYRGLAAFAEQVAVLLMINFSAHVTDDVIRLLTEARLRVITFASHTTQVFHVIDLAPLSLSRGVRGRNCLSGTILRWSRSQRMDIMISDKRWYRLMYGRAFQALGLEFDRRREPCQLLFDEETPRGSADFRELEYVDFPVDQLSGRHRTVRFGWINRPE
jgi:hypothetical protein